MRSIQSTLFTLLAASSSAFADTTLNLTPGVSPISHDVYELHMLTFWICVVIGVLVFSAMFYSIIYHRKSRGAKPAEFHSHPVLEITWTVIPALILVLMAIPATKVLLNMNNQDPDDLTIQVTGYQWKWHYKYIEDDVSFYSNLSTPYAQIYQGAPKTAEYLREVDNPLVVPIHKKIRFLITSNDVNHAWWVPDFGVKRDAIAGLYNEAWTIIDKPGTYRGQCAELCGIQHAFMPIVVIATTEQGYKDWVAKQKGQGVDNTADIVKEWTMKDLMTLGETTYNRICVACHQAGGTGSPPLYPALKGSKIATGPITGHLDIVFNGKSGTGMQAFKSQLNDMELAAVITYERNAFGNNTNTLVQPVQVKALRDGKTLEEALATKPSAAGAANTKAGKAPPPTTPMPTTPPAPGTVPPATTPAAPGVATVPAATTPGATPTSQAPTPATAVTTPAAATATAAAAPTASADALKESMKRGEAVYLKLCVACHQQAGTGVPPTFPALKGSKIATGPLADHINQILNGKAGTAMVAFKDQLTDQEIADVITYERNAFGNNTGNLVTPDQIKAARAQTTK